MKMSVKVDRHEFTEQYWVKAEKLGCTLVGYSFNREYGLGGNTFPVKDQLKAAGFRFEPETKTWIGSAESFTKLEG